MVFLLFTNSYELIPYVN